MALSEIALAEQAKEAFLDDNFEAAVDFYSKAIELNPQNPDLYADRAQANIKLTNFTDAVADSSKALELDASLAKAYLRKGIACMKLEEYLTAKAALGNGVSLVPNDSRFKKLIEECDQRIAEESGIPTNPLQPSVVSNIASLSPSVETASPSEESKQGFGVTTAAVATTSLKPKFRHEFFQKPEEVVVTIFAKGIPAKNVTVDFGEQVLSVTIDIPGEEPYRFQPRLFGKIIPSKSRYEVMSTKVEIRLVKVELITWTSLEYNKETKVHQKVYVSSGNSQRPAYPSSKSKARDWDKLEAQVKNEEKDEKLDGDAALNKMFQDIYKDADEDMRRAMMKSFVESNGTVLSTDWKDVGSKKIEGSAPQGMEMKKWEI